MNERIRTLRDLHNESEEVFAANLGITVERLRYIEMGRVLPNVKELWTMVQKYGTTMQYLMGDLV